MPDYYYAYQDIEEILDEDLQGLFDEIANHCRIPKSGMVIHFVHQALASFGPQKPEKFNRLELIPWSPLRKKVRDFAGSEIYRLCQDLAAIARIGSIENHNNSALYTLINKIAFDQKTSKKRVGR